ncbi:MAG: hypothetical protein F6J90_01865 [Moorea sp. SIOASIH]|uniref:hypothetical protein n=1 Tax=Moorena sp. SIOASIH TaxID=2607817 RepID=UPI0013BD499D|nr:hypothetical protein [Moorena sp. SIOASIH]NEO35115.1 hypothetical protein [Moorena sp. SIOASIH]
MARIAINDLSVAQESESFLTELKDTDVAMDQINGGIFFLLALAAAAARRRRANTNSNVTTPRFTITPTITFTLGNRLNLGNNN